MGSSNLSRSGILDGIEWSAGVDDVAPFLDSFERLWNEPRSRPLSHDLLRAYRSKWRPGRTPVPDVELEPLAQPVAPRPVQREALDALEQTRLAGHAAGLVVMATGLGKTWVAAFDTARPSFRRVLFVAHRDEILRQSRDVFRAVQPDADLGLFTGTEKHPAARVVFASVQTLARHLTAFDAEEFDYVVVDEFHHAAARSYRKVLDHFRPGFLLGLTATPERLDGADLLALCDDNLVFECMLVDGIHRGDLASFGYFGIRDVVDYEPIPWRNGRFDPDVLTSAVATRTRAQQALDEWRRHGGGPTLGFCVTVRHADFMANFFTELGVRAAAVHTGPTSAPRRQTIEDLRAGRIDVVFSVDVFNEGLDVPSVTTVMMLRPTESSVVFLQQLGRGLRRTEDKTSVVVLDFIGNHRSFLLKPRTLLGAATAKRPSTSEVVAAMRSGEFQLPPGCSVTFDIEAVDILARLARVCGISRDPQHTAPWRTSAARTQPRKDAGRRRCRHGARAATRRRPGPSAEDGSASSTTSVCSPVTRPRSGAITATSSPASRPSRSPGPTSSSPSRRWSTTRPSEPDRASPSSPGPPTVSLPQTPGWSPTRDPTPPCPTRSAP